jgi:phage terminase large subunit
VARSLRVPARRLRADVGEDLRAEPREDLVAQGALVPKSADPEAQGRTLSGLHAKYIAYFLDESGDMPTSLGRTAEQGLGNCAWGKILTGGNTTSQTGLLYEVAVRQRHLWTVFSITGDPTNPKRSPRVPIDWAKQQIESYGRENPWVMAFVLGEFPPGGLNTLLSVEDMEPR